MKMKFRFNKVLPSFLLVSLVALVAGCQSQQINDAMSIGSKLVGAASISDQTLKAETAAMISSMDKANKVAPASSNYQKRLVKITRNLKSVNGTPLNYKVYLTSDINAFALPDGSIRVYSGLMDKMSDDEVLFVIGHEVGHVAHGHTKKRMQTALMTSAAFDVAKSAGSPGVAALTSSQLGELVEKVINAQFSQANEEESDDYGLSTLKRSGVNPVAAETALEKLASLNAGNSTLVSQMLSTHPEPSARVARIREKIKADAGSR